MAPLADWYLLTNKQEAELLAPRPSWVRWADLDDEKLQVHETCHPESMMMMIADDVLGIFDE